jgi:predicted deacylase
VLPQIPQRELGRLRSEQSGPTLICVAGIHGNEPAGVFAARRVFERLAKGDLKFTGEFVAFAGNLEGLRRGVRYQERDLNRAWTDDRVAFLNSKVNLAAEDREQSELLGAIAQVKERARGPVHLGDLHTTSAAGIPFILFGDTLEQRKFARAFPLPVILGLEEQLDGVLTAYWTKRGCVTFAIEGGQHQAADSVDSIEAVIWIALAKASLIESGIPEVVRSAALLDERRGKLPRTVEVVSRRSITEEDSFKMEPGFRNIDRAHKGQLLARDRGGEIRAPSDGMVLLPLYQGLGGDGFFWGRAVGRTRLLASETLRFLGADRLLSLLPGVERDSRNPSQFVVDKPRPIALSMFHLFGYRRVRQSGAGLTVGT